ncbi:ETC complex I subunit [Alphaproteobacteria bacterium]|nr:ETC complex I subunit [Alphaproteobacteria bacterium]
MSKVLIKKPCKTNMQSGLHKTKNWIIEFPFDPTIKKDVLMGWNSSRDTNKQISLNFVSLEDAKKWCINNNHEFSIIDETKRTLKPKSYASNFANNRRTSWTH